MGLGTWRAVRCRRNALRAYAESNVIGGWAAYRQVRGVLRRSVALGRLRLDALDAHRARLHAWELVEAKTEDSLLDTLSGSVARRDGETDDEYDGRLRRVAQVFRARLDGPPATLVTPTPSTRAGPEHSQEPVIAQEPAKPSVVHVVTRRERSDINKAFYANHRRLPSPSEFKREVERAHAA